MQGFLFVFAAATFWGVAGVIVKFLYRSRDIDPVTLTQLRVTLCFLCGGLFLAVLKPRLLRIRLADLPFVALYGLVGITSTQITYYCAIHESSVSVAIFLQFCAPILTCLYEILFQHRRPGRFTFPVLALAIGGALLLLFGRGGRPAAPAAGIAWGVASAFALATYTLIGRSAVRRLNPWTLLFWSTGISSLFWAVVHPVRLVLATPWTPVDWGFFLYLAVFTTFVPFGLYLTGLKSIGATTAIVTGGLEPVWATVLAGLVLGEGLAVGQILGCLAILTAVVSLQVLPGAAITDARPAGAPPGESTRAQPTPANPR